CRGIGRQPAQVPRPARQPDAHSTQAGDRVKSNPAPSLPRRLRCDITALGDISLDYRKNPRTATYAAVVVRSDSGNGGASVIFLEEPKIVRDAAATSPLVFFQEGDTTATKKIYAPALVERKPAAMAAMLLYGKSNGDAATTFAAADVVRTAWVAP
ncbi:MAG: hypothetical protein AB7F35_20220, partial [Acetobacteraceae bacterium]